MNNIEIAVGQVWEGDTSGDGLIVEVLGERRVCVRYNRGKDLGMFTRADLLRNYTLTKHQNGADIDTEKYDYAMGNDDAPFYWSVIVAKWVTRGENRRADSFTRIPKVKELPYVDCKIYADCDTDELCFRNAEGYEFYQSRALDHPKFIGYVYDDNKWGVGLDMRPRLHADDNLPAYIPTHVRFAR